MELHKAEITEIRFLEAPGSPEPKPTTNVPLTPKILDTTGEDADKGKKASVTCGTRKRMSPCQCSKPEACTVKQLPLLQETLVMTVRTQSKVTPAEAQFHQK